MEFMIVGIAFALLPLLLRLALRLRLGIPGRVYIYYTLEEIQNDLRCAHGKAVKLLAELDKGKGFSLIERVKQGQGRPTKIYVKRFTTRNVPPPPPQPEPESDPEPRPPIFGIADFRKSEVQTSENRKSRLPKTRSADFRKSDGSYIKSNQTESIYTDLSIHPSPSTQNRGLIDRYDRYDCREEIESQIDFLGLCRQYAQEDVDGIIELMVDTLCSVHPSIRIGGEPIPINQVRSRFLSLERKHIESWSLLRYPSGGHDRLPPAAVGGVGVLHPCQKPRERQSKKAQPQRPSGEIGTYHEQAKIRSRNISVPSGTAKGCHR